MVGAGLLAFAPHTAQAATHRAHGHEAAAHKAHAASAHRAQGSSRAHAEKSSAHHKKVASRARHAPHRVAARHHASGASFAAARNNADRAYDGGGLVVSGSEVANLGSASLGAPLGVMPQAAAAEVKPVGMAAERVAMIRHVSADQSPRAACLAAVQQAERVHGLPHGLLVAIAMSESGLHSYALNLGGRAYFPDNAARAKELLHKARGGYIMAGCVQVNARVNAPGKDWPLDPYRAADWAGGTLRNWYNQTGNWSEALARWHGGTPASTRQVQCRVRAKLEVVAPNSSILADIPCDTQRMARERSNGRALLARAENQGMEMASAAPEEVAEAR